MEVLPDYLRAIAHHKIVLQLDRSHVPGQVAGDALLCLIPCVGATAQSSESRFPKTCGEVGVLVDSFDRRRFIKISRSARGGSL